MVTELNYIIKYKQLLHTFISKYYKKKITNKTNSSASKITLPTEFKILLEIIRQYDLSNYYLTPGSPKKDENYLEFDLLESFRNSSAITTAIASYMTTTSKLLPLMIKKLDNNKCVALCINILYINNSNIYGNKYCCTLFNGTDYSTLLSQQKIGSSKNFMQNIYDAFCEFFHYYETTISHLNTITYSDLGVKIITKKIINDNSLVKPYYFDEGERIFKESFTKS
jgi:hypothetical protein